MASDFKISAFFMTPIRGVIFLLAAQDVHLLCSASLLSIHTFKLSHFFSPIDCARVHIVVALCDTLVLCPGILLILDDSGG